MGHAALVEQPGRLFQVLAAGDAEAEMVQAHPVRVETVGRGGHRPQPHDQVAADHDDAAEQDPERLGRGRIIGRRRLHRDLEAQQVSVELAAALHVGHREPEVMDVTAWNLPGHHALPPATKPQCSAASALASQAAACAASRSSESRGHACLAQSPKSRSARAAQATPASGSTQRKLPERPK